MTEELKTDWLVEPTLLAKEGPDVGEIKDWPQEELVELSGRPHNEAQMLGFTAFLFPDGTKWNVTYREGTESAPALEFASTLHTISSSLIKKGCVPQGVPWPPADVAAQREKRLADLVEMRAQALAKEREPNEDVQQQIQGATLKAHKKAIAQYAVLIGLMSNTRDIAGSQKLLKIGNDAGLSPDDMVDKHAEWLKAVTLAVVKPKQHPPAEKAKQPQSRQPPREQVPSRQAPKGGGEIKFTRIRVAAKKDDSPIIEFWRGRDYAEIRYHRSAKLLLEMADQGFHEAFDQADLETIGLSVPFAGIIHWVPSENLDQNGNPYKNVSFVEST